MKTIFIISIIVCTFLVLYKCYTITYLESFVFETDKKFFILQHDKRDNITYTINNINDCTRIGYMDPEHIDIFERIYKMTNNEDNSMRFNYVKLQNPRIEDVDILLYVNDAIYVKDYKIINYFTVNRVLKDKYFKNYSFVVHNDVGRSVLVLSTKTFSNLPSTETNNINNTPQRVSISDKYNFVIEDNINGKYSETDMNTSTITLYQNKLLDLEVKVGDTILVKNQPYDFFNGEYVVSNVNRYILMSKNVELPPALNVCVDENMNELPEYKNKESCEHHNDLLGMKKAVPANWDARCRRNMECPFFNEDDNYTGQCYDGTCFMPYEVQQISFTKYK